MILRFKRGTPESEVLAVEAEVAHAGGRTIRSNETLRTILAVVDKLPREIEAKILERDAVEDRVDPPGAWHQAHRSFRDTPTVVKIGDLRIGEGHPCVIMSGPCSVEGEEAVMENARRVKQAGAHMLRGGAFKPRSSPYAFQGFGVEGLGQLKRAGDAHGLPIVSEIMDASQVEAFVEAKVDCLQIGARNMQNFTLLKAAARANRPVLLKRGLSATVQEWLSAAEYLMQGGCPDVILCERGIRTFETATRNTLDLTVLPLLREWTHLPIVVDPSHAAGIASLIPVLCRASVAAGADGLTVEMHLNPAEARSDGPQALLPGELKKVVAEARVLSALF